MAEFNYPESVKNNPLLQEEVKDKLLTESQEVSEEAPSSKTTVSELKAQIKEMILASLSEDEVGENQVKEDEPIDELFDEDDFWGSEKAKEQEKYGLKPGEKPHVEEAEEDEEVEVDIEDEIEADAEPAMEPEIDAAPEAGLSQDEQEIQNSLKLAYDNAVAIGDDKLADQIGNSITFFTRTHVVER